MTLPNSITFRMPSKGKSEAVKRSNMKYDFFNSKDIFDSSIFYKKECEETENYLWRFKRDIRLNQERISLLNIVNERLYSPKGNYVYAVYRGEGFEDLIYIGKGVKDRWLHTISGRSHVKELNQEYFTGAQIKVCIVKDGLTESEASCMESHLILYFKDYLVNIKGSNFKATNTAWDSYYNICSHDLYCNSNLSGVYINPQTPGK